MTSPKRIMEIARAMQRMEQTIAETGNGSAATTTDSEMPAASTLAIHDQAMSSKPSPFAYWAWRVEALEAALRAVVDDLMFYAKLAGNDGYSETRGTASLIRAHAILRKSPPSSHGDPEQE